MKLTLPNWNRIWGANDEPAPMSEAGKKAVKLTEAAKKVTAPTTPTVQGPTTAAWSNFGSGYGWGSDWAHRNDIDLVAPHVYQGGALDLLPAGIDAVVNVDGRADKFPSWQPIQGSIWLPIGDDPRCAPPIEWIGQAVNAIERFRENGWDVFVHCAMGISRSGMVTVAYVMKKDRLTVEAALAKVRKGRPCTHPNSGFMRALDAWQRHLGIASEPIAVTAQTSFARNGVEGVRPTRLADLTGEPIPPPPVGELRKSCPSCGYLYYHSRLCPSEQNQHPSVPGEQLGEVIAAYDSTPTAEADEGEDLVGDGTGDATHCGQCGREFLVTGEFEDCHWCWECLEEETEHREAIASAAREDRTMIEALSEQVAGTLA